MPRAAVCVLDGIGDPCERLMSFESALQRSGSICGCPHQRVAEANPPTQLDEPRAFCRLGCRQFKPEMPLCRPNSVPKAMVCRTGPVVVFQTKSVWLNAF